MGKLWRRFLCWRFGHAWARVGQHDPGKYAMNAETCARCGLVRLLFAPGGTVRD